MSAIGGVNTTGLDFDLTKVFTDEILAAGESAVFSLAFTGSARENSRLREDVGRVHNNQINEIIHDFIDSKTVHWLDINQVFLDKEGKLNRDLMPFGLHPSEKGYITWAEKWNLQSRNSSQKRHAEASI